MKLVGSQLFGKSDKILENSLNHRLAKQNVILSNISNSNTPGFRALGYEFESQLRTAVGDGDSLPMKTNHAQHVHNPGVSANGQIKPDLFVKPTESIGSDGNTVDVDQEMSDMAANQILFRSTVELLNRRLGMLKYGINGGR